MAELKEAGIFFALSCTVTRTNFDTVTDTRFIQSALDAGCKLFLLLEYTPIRAGTDEWVITDEQRRGMKAFVAGFRRRFPAVFIAIPQGHAGESRPVQGDRGRLRAVE
jgi:hypothetical protein